MPSRILHLFFDDILLRQNVVGKRDFSSVHHWMDEWYAKRKNPIIDVHAEICEVKACIMEKGNSADEDELTDYLRVALGHLLLDATWDNFLLKNEYQLLKLVFQRYMDSGFCDCRFKTPFESAAAKSLAMTSFTI